MSSKMDDQPAVLVMTGALGAGKSTLVRGLSALGLPGVGCYEFDSVGVPAPEEMERVWGGGDQWQAAMTDQWIERLLRNDDGVEVAVLDGQTRPSTVREVFARRGVRLGRIVLVDCGHDERNARLRGPRGQPELAIPQMDCWAAYLTGQAHALGLPILRSDGRSVEEGVAELATYVRELVALRRAPSRRARRRRRRSRAIPRRRRYRFGCRAAASVLASHTVSVGVEAIGISPDHTHGALHVRRTVPAAACTVDVAVDRDAWLVVRIAASSVWRVTPGLGRKLLFINWGERVVERDETVRRRREDLRRARIVSDAPASIVAATARGQPDGQRQEKDDQSRKQSPRHRCTGDQ
jgi:hypothetical protein